MTVHGKIAQSRWETGMRRAARTRGALEQYVKGASDEPASRRQVTASNPRLQQMRSWIMQA